MSHTTDIQADVRALLCSTLCIGDHELDEKVLLADYGLSSIDMLDVIAKLESRYGVKFKPESMANLTTASLVRNVESLLATA